MYRSYLAASHATCPPACRRSRDSRRAFQLDATDRGLGGIRNVDHARPNRRLHLQVRVVGVKGRHIDIRATAGDGRLQTAFVAPGPFRRVAAAGLRRREVEPAALEPARRGGVGEQRSRAHETRDRTSGSRRCATSHPCTSRRRPGDEGHRHVERRQLTRIVDRLVLTGDSGARPSPTPATSRRSSPVRTRPRYLPSTSGLRRFSSAALVRAIDVGCRVGFVEEEQTGDPRQPVLSLLSDRDLLGPLVLTSRKWTDVKSSSVMSASFTMSYSSFRKAVVLVSVVDAGRVAVKRAAPPYWKIRPSASVDARTSRRSARVVHLESRLHGQHLRDRSTESDPDASRPRRRGDCCAC